MARNRMLNPEFWLDEEIAAVSPHARLLYMGLWGICDDTNATLPNRPEWIKIQVFPYEASVSIQGLLDELIKIGKVVPFSDASNKPYLWLRNFKKHQRIDRPSASKYPPFAEDSTSTRPELKEVKRKELKEGDIIMMEKGIQNPPKTLKTGNLVLAREEIDATKRIAEKMAQDKGKFFKKIHLSA